jgi:DNA-binding protein
VELGTINISTEEVSNREGSNSNVSAIEIQLNK